MDKLVYPCLTCLLSSLALVYTPFHERENLTHLLGVIAKEEKRNPFQALIRTLV